MKTDLFQSCGHCWVFQICWHIECSNFTASSFRIWNSSTGIPSSPLTLFVIMLPKTHLTSHSRILVLGEWSHHHDYLSCEDLFCTVLLCILATSSYYLLLLLGLYHFCPLLSPSLREARVQQYVNHELPDVQAGFRKGRRIEIKLSTYAGSSKKWENSRKISIFDLLTMSKRLTVWITINCGKFWKRWDYQTTWPASWEICMQVSKQQLELDMEQQTGSK